MPSGIFVLTTGTRRGRRSRPRKVLWARYHHQNRPKCSWGSALCLLARGQNDKAKAMLKRVRPLAASGTNADKFVGVLEKVCDRDFFANPLMVPPTGGAEFDLGNIVPVEVSFLKHSFLQLVVDS